MWKLFAYFSDEMYLWSDWLSLKITDTPEQGK